MNKMVVVELSRADRVLLREVRDAIRALAPERGGGRLVEGSGGWDGSGWRPKEGEDGLPPSRG